MYFLETLENRTRMSKKLFKLLIAALTLSLVIGLFYPFFNVSRTVEVIKITDGDTVDVRFDGGVETIRFKGIDTPETTGYNTPEEYRGVPNQNWECLQSWGYKAKDYVEQKTEGRKITLQYRKGVLTVERGVFNRLIGKIYVSSSNKSLNHILVEKGYARSYGEYYQSLEQEARQNSIGLWECAE